MLAWQNRSRVPGYRNLAEQMHKAGKLQSTRFVFPTANFNRDAGERAWYPPSTVTFDDDKDGDVAGFLPALDVVDDLIANEIESGIPRKNIILGGFSQGAAVTSLWGVLRQRAREDRVAGLVLCAGYVPLRGKLVQIKESSDGCIKNQPLCLIHGESDTLLPLYVAMRGKPVLEELGFEVNYVTIPGMRHEINGQAMGYLCMFLESVLAEAGAL